MTDKTETPLTVEMLMRALRGANVVAGYNGSCELAVGYKELHKALSLLIQPSSTQKAILNEAER